MDKRNDSGGVSDFIKPKKCPDLPKGQHCWLCGGSYICLESWRKRRTAKQRIAARKAEIRKEAKP